MKIYVTSGPVGLLPEEEKSVAREFPAFLASQLAHPYKVEECQFEWDALGWSWSLGQRPCRALIVACVGTLSERIRLSVLEDRADHKKRTPPVPVLALLGYRNASWPDHTRICIGVETYVYRCEDWQFLMFQDAALKIDDFLGGVNMPETLQAS